MKKLRLFYKLFFPFFLLGISIVVGFSVFIYNSTYHSVEEEFLKDKQNYTKQILNNVEQKVRTIEYGYTAYSSTATFETIFKQPLSGKDFDTYRDIKKEINYIEMMGIEGSKHNLISIDQNWGIIEGSLKELSEEEIAGYKQKYINEATQSLFWRPTSTGIEMIMTLPIYQRDKFALGISNIPRSSIDEIVDNEKDNLVEIYNSKNELLYSSRKKARLLSLENYEAIMNEGEDIKIVDADGEKYVYAQSDYNRWIYVVQINPTEISNMINNTRIGLLIVSTLLIILVGIISYMLANSFSRPIRKIQEKLAIHDVSGQKSELSLVADSVDKIIGQNETLVASLTMQKPQLETLFVLSLFRNRITANEAKHRLKQFGYFFNETNHFYTGLIQIDNMDSQKIVEKDLYLLALNNIVEEIVPDKERLIPIVLNDEMQATIFITDENDYESSRRIMKYYEEIQTAAKEYLDITISVGISPVYKKLISSKKAVDLAKEALHYRVNVGPESIIFYDDIAPLLNDASISKYPVELQNELVNTIRSGNEEEVKETVDTLIDEIFRMNKNPVSLEVTLIRLINEIIQLGQLLGAEAKIFDSIKPLYYEAINAYYPDRIKQMLIEHLITPIIISTQDKTDKEFRSLSDKIVQIIQTEYDQEISLDIIADRLHYNPNYLSSVFKKEYGENFVDYLMGFRLQKAKSLLQETNIPIKEIAEKLQYRNSQNFIRFFKKKVGMTPGDYRKQYNH
ncbi:helix-turn-helix transcriptional regulator [Niallia circulans]|uniref:Helix-turn-helix transcriptional regulator n=1 Tax=Niallia circulans TaxID=1397 RepID=A0A941GI91_NIACI|nr:helix-turn-helix transcriptional regulator [Niallia circulans]MCB5236444.1 helix-turn-helix transcriptional regulator [Niallia circulans]